MSTIKYKVLEFGNNLTNDFDDSTIDFVDVTSAFDNYNLWQKNLTSDYGDLTIAFDDYKSNSRFWWCNISLWWQHIIKDFGDVTLAFDDFN